MKSKRAQTRIVRVLPPVQAIEFQEHISAKKFLLTQELLQSHQDTYEALQQQNLVIWEQNTSGGQASQPRRGQVTRTNRETYIPPSQCVRGATRLQAMSDLQPSGAESQRQSPIPPDVVAELTKQTTESVLAAMVNMNK